MPPETSASSVASIATIREDANPTVAKFATVQIEGGREVVRQVEYYSLDVILSVGYRVKSARGILFRRWANAVLRDYLLRGHAVNERLVQIEDRMDRRLAEHGRRLDALEDRVDFFVRTQTPPLQGVFYDGQLWDARAFVDRLVKSARKSLLLVDNWATVETLDMLTAKQKGVAVTVVTSEHRDHFSRMPPCGSTAGDIRRLPGLSSRLTRARAFCYSQVRQPHRALVDAGLPPPVEELSWRTRLDRGFQEPARKRNRRIPK